MKILGEDIIVIDAMFVSAVIICSMFAYIFIMPRPIQPIFPLWILNEYHKAPQSQMTVTTNESYLLYIGTENMMGQAEYCQILVKFRNMSMPIPSTANLTSTPTDPILSYNFFLAKDNEWEEKFEFQIIGEENESSFLFYGIEINNKIHETRLKSDWSEGLQGYYYQFIFELWLFNEITTEFSFSGVWVTSPFLHINSH